MPNRDKLLTSLATTIADYRKGEIPLRDENVIDKWVRQFPNEAQTPILTELDHVFAKSYMTKKTVKGFLRHLLTAAKFVGEHPKQFWENTGVLDIQTQGNSQHDMLALLDVAMRDIIGLELANCGKGKPERFVYIDDFLYSGGRIRADIKGWIQNRAPAKTELHIITIGLHRSGWWFAKNQISDCAKAAGKDIKVTWWRLHEVEDRKSETNACDVLRPTKIPGNAKLQAYLADKFGIADLRKPGNAGPLKLYSSDDGKIFLEQQFLLGGFDVLEKCAYLRQKEQMRPLGNSFFGAGLGSPFVTYRNCANNTPLVFWAGDPWYPLFPRKIN